MFLREKRNRILDLGINSTYPYAMGIKTYKSLIMQGNFVKDAASKINNIR